jgi:hypothetical protein
MAASFATTADITTMRNNGALTHSRRVRGVTLIRITNDEVFGDREILLKKVRQGLLRALLRGKS